MPEAVIVDAIRTPIGRAVKGSLKDVRADDLAAVPLKALVDRNPGVDFAQTDDIMMGCGFQAGEQGANVGRNAAAARGHRPSRPRDHGQPLLRLLAADDPDGLPRDQGRGGRPVHRRRHRGRLALPRRRGVGAPPQAQRLRGLAVRRLHPDGHDGRERRRALQGQPRGAGRVGRDVPAARGRRARRRALRRRDRRRSPRPTAPRSPATTARAPARRSRSSPSSSRPSSPRRHASRPATPARSTTAPPRCS